MGVGDPVPGQGFGEAEGHTRTSWAGLLGSTGWWTLTWDSIVLLSVSTGPVAVAAVAMLVPRAAPLLTLLLATGSLGQRAQRPPRRPSPISTIQPKASFDAQQVELGGGGGSSSPSFAAPFPCALMWSLPQFAGTWLLVAVASSCRFLQEQGHRAEATSLHVAPQGAAMAVSTFRKL